MDRIFAQAGVRFTSAFGGQNYIGGDMHAYESVSAARAGIGKYFMFFNTRRPHSSLDRQTPDTVYFKNLPLAAAA